MKFCIDPDVCKQTNCTPDILFYIAALYFKAPISLNTFMNVCSKGFIEYDGFSNKEPINLRLSQDGINFIESVLLNSEFRPDVAKEDRYDSLAVKLMELYPKGRKEGTSYMWRDSKSIIAKKLKALVKRTGAEFTDEQAIEATKKYVESFNGNYTYMQLLKYFISKRLVVGGEIEETSQLLSYIENANQESLDNDWTSRTI